LADLNGRFLKFGKRKDEKQRKTYFTAVVFLARKRKVRS